MHLLFCVSVLFDMFVFFVLGVGGPAGVVRAEPIFVLERLKWVNSIFYDEMRIPLEAFVSIACLRYSATI